MPASHTATLRVRYAETDQMGVVYHANYLIWMEVGRVELCRALGMRYRDLEEGDGVLLAVVETRTRYLSPARYDDQIAVETSILDANPRQVRFAYTVRHHETGRTLATGETRHLFCDRQVRPRRLPERYFPLFGIPARAAE